MAEFIRVETSLADPGKASRAVHVVELNLPELIDPLEFDRLNEQVLTALDGKGGERWIVDLSRVTYMGSAMLGLMVNIRQRVKSAGGRLVLCGLSSRLSDVFRACSMERLFTIARTRADALRLSGR